MYFMHENKDYIAFEALNYFMYPKELADYVNI